MPKKLRHGQLIAFLNVQAFSKNLTQGSSAKRLTRVYDLSQNYSSTPWVGGEANFGL